MNLLKTEKLFSLMKQFGVEYLKTSEVEIKMGPIHGPDPLPIVKALHSVVPMQTNIESAAAAPPVEMEIPHHENQVAKLLKLSDEQLVDKLFPEGAPQNADN